MTRGALYVLFTASGFAGLIYESIWTQYLKLFLGHAAYAQSLVLAVFMGGMAAGAAWCARRSAAGGRGGAGDALFHQQPGRRGRRAGERLRADRRGRLARDAARGRRDESRDRGGGRAARPPGALSPSRAGVPGGRWRAAVAR